MSNQSDEKKTSLWVLLLKIQLIGIVLTIWGMWIRICFHASVILPILIMSLGFLATKPSAELIFILCVVSYCTALIVEDYQADSDYIDNQLIIFTDLSQQLEDFAEKLDSQKRD